MFLVEYPRLMGSMLTSRVLDSQGASNTNVRVRDRLDGRVLDTEVELDR